MRSAYLALILLVSTSYFVLCQPLPRDPISDRAQLLSSISQISKAYASRDPLPFQRLYLSNYASIKGKPVYNTRDQLIAMMTADSVFVRSGRKLAFKTLRYENEEPQLYLYGSTAVVNVARTNQWQYFSQKCLTRQQATEVWVKPDNEWRIAVGHTTTIQCDPKPYHPMHPAVEGIPSQTKPPPNEDLEAERAVREIIKTFAGAQASLEEPIERVIERYTVDSFVSTNPAGEVSTDRSLLSTIPAAVPLRSVGLRNQDDAVLIYEDAAVYTYRVRNPIGARQSDNPQQCSIVFAKFEGRWMIVAAHCSKFSSD